MKGIVLTAMDDEIYEVLSDNEIFADLFNGALFGGNQVIRSDMLDIPPELEPWVECIQDYKVNLVCSSTVDSSNFRTGLREVFELLPLLKDKDGMKEFLETRKDELMHMDAKKSWLVARFLNIPVLKELKENEKGEVDMCTAIKEMMEEREEMGVERGEIRVNQLIEILLGQSGRVGDFEEIRKAVTDREYQKRLFDEYGI